MTDEELARAHLAGDREAFRELVVRYQSRLVTLLFRCTGDQGIAEELGQDAFLRFYRALPRLDLSQPLKPYLLQIAVNAARDWARRGRSKELELDEAEEVASVSWDVDETLSLEGALMKLPLIYREAITLHYQMEMDYAEIARALKVSEETVRTRLRRALEHLRAIMKEV